MKSPFKIIQDKSDTEPRFPPWLRRKMPKGHEVYQTHEIIDKYKLNTVCSEAKCPNRAYCFSKSTATFLVLGKACTRACAFCDIDFSKNPELPEEDEPMRVAKSIELLKLKHVVITMVTRDDMQDGGAKAFAAIMQKAKEHNPGITLEVLTSDFNANPNSLNLVLNERPEIFNHNIETVRELTPKIRHKAQYERTLEVLAFAKQSSRAKFVKSGIMVGLGESQDQVKETIFDLRQAGCDIITIGQYLQASKRKIVVKEFVTPEKFKLYEDYAKSLGVKYIYSAPFVRSSYNAKEVFEEITCTQNQYQS
jgi:lipoyl synthase